MAQPLRVINRNVVSKTKSNQVNLDQGDAFYKPFKNQIISRDENAFEGKNGFRSKIPVFKSRVCLSTLNANCEKQDFKSTHQEQPKKQSACNQIVHKTEPIPVPKKEPIENIDIEQNCFLLSDYAAEIYQYLRTLELSQALPKKFLALHNCVTPNMRAVLVNWVIGVHKTFRLYPETLYLTVSIIDRYLSRQRIERDQIQLLGATALFVAAKFEEVYYPSVRDFVHVCDNLYTKRDILKMEQRILTVIDFELSGPSPLNFLRRGSKAAHADSRVHMMGKYLCELSMMSYECAQWVPSLVAATALYLALNLVNKCSDANNQECVWTPTIEHYTGYSLSEVRKFSIDMCRLVLSSETSKHQNCRKKYQSVKYLSISNFPVDMMTLIKELAKIQSS